MSGNDSPDLTEGSVCPDVIPGSYRCFSMRFCPFAHRARLVLAHKDVTHDIVNINLKAKPSWYKETKNPMGTIPTIEHGDKIVYESGICMEYVDDIFPVNRLMPADPYIKAKHKILMERFMKVAFPFSKFLNNKDEATRNTANEDMKIAVVQFEEALEKAKSTFYGGEKPCMLDLYMWPFFERGSALANAAIPSLKTFMLDPNHTPKLCRWAEAMREVPCVKATSNTQEQYDAFYAAM